MDAQTMSNLKDSLSLEKKPEETSEKDWDKMNKMGCGIIRSCLTQDIKYHVMIETSAKKIWEILEGKYLTKSIENLLYMKRRLYHFQFKNGISIGEYMNTTQSFL